MEDRFFEKGKSYAEARFSPFLCGDACVVRVDAARPEVLSGRDDVEFLLGKWVAKLEKQGYKAATKPTLPGVQTPATIAAITGHKVPARYARFLAEGPHPSGTVDGITGFADGIPIVFDDPIIPFWLKRFGWDKTAPRAIPIAIVEEGRALSIDAKTGAIYVYDNSATKPHVKVYDSLDELLANVEAKPSKKRKRR